jgi:hypothetical protein
MQAYPSTRFAAALTQDHLYATMMQIYDPSGNLLYTVETIESADDEPAAGNNVRIIDGSVTQDKSADIRTQCSVKLIDPSGDLIPQSNTGYLTPWGNEIWLYSGIGYPTPPVDPTTGQLPIVTEYVLMGKFRISKVAISESKGAPQITVTGYDRSRNVSRNVVQLYWPSTTDFLALGNQPFAFGIQLIITDRWPPATFDGSVAQWTSYQSDTDAVFPVIPQTQSEGTDLWSIARQYAQACACDLFVNRQGVFVMYQDPNFTNVAPGAGPPTAFFTEGSTAYFQEVERDLDDTAAYNCVIVFGEGTTLEGSFASIPAVDYDPASPTYFGPQQTQEIKIGNEIVPSIGPYGSVTNCVTSNILVTQIQINAYALYLLNLAIGSQEAVNVPSLACNPCIDVDDLISITRARDGIANANITYIVDSVTFPLVAKGTMQMKLREKRNM